MTEQQEDGGRGQRRLVALVAADGDLDAFAAAILAARDADRDGRDPPPPHVDLRRGGRRDS